MRYTLILLALVLVACGSQFDFLKPSASKAIDEIACANSQSRLYDVLYASLVDLQQVPMEQELKKVFEHSLEDHPEFQVDKSEFLGLISEFYQILLRVEAKDPKELLEKLTALEIGDQTTLEARNTQNALKQFQSKLNQYTAQNDIQCSQQPSDPPTSETPPPAVIPPPSPGDQNSGDSPINLVSFGARKVLATAYQSCAADEKPPMTLSTPEVEGISVVGTHSDGIGSKRQITDLTAVQQTNYYLRNLSLSSSCRDVRNNPLIYDYGGKPSTGSDPSSPIDLFQNSGSGTSVLGIDCSGYVFSAIASAGLKLDPAKKMKAILVHGINARMYMDPAANGMPCLSKVSMGVSGTLKAGDIAAIPGHVVIVESVGVDPFGISKVKSAEQCSSISSKNFNFVIAQSSPSKNGIGINKYLAADYLSEQDAIRSGFEKYARDACRAKFEKKDVLMKASDFQVVRHNQTAACMDKPITLVGESCVSSCRSLASGTTLGAFENKFE